MTFALGIATGSFWRHSNPHDQNVAIEQVRALDTLRPVECVELTYGYTEHFATPLSPSSLTFLSTRIVSVHFPLHVDPLSPEGATCMQRIRAISEQVPITYIVVHPNQFRTPADAIRFAAQASLPVATEVLEEKKQSLHDFALFQRATDLPFILDTGHAESHPWPAMHSFLAQTKHRICAVHLNKFHGGKAHQSFHERGDSKPLAFVRSLAVPCVLEEDFAPGRHDAGRAEWQYLADYFDSSGRM